MTSDCGREWIEWDGGLCPVPSHALVEVRFRYKRFGEKMREAGKVDWGRFANEQMLTDIVAYRMAPNVSGLSHTGVDRG